MVINVLYLMISLDSYIKARKFEPNRILKESRQQPKISMGFLGVLSNQSALPKTRVKADVDGA